MAKNSIRVLAVVAVALSVACGRADRIAGPAANVAAGKASVAFAPSFASVATVPSPPGLRACFAAENNATDIVSNNLGTLTGGASYTLDTQGKFGRAFKFSAQGDGVNVPASASLNVGIGPGLTIAAWVNAQGTVFQPAPPNVQITGSGPIAEYDFGAQLWHHSQQNSHNALFTNMATGPAPGQWNILTSQEGMPQDGTWRHAAVTYHKATGELTLFINGTPRETAFIGTITPNTTQALRIGRRAFEFVGGDAFSFNGLIDEVQIYERALTEAEVAGVAAAAGTMCVAPPVSYDVTQLPAGVESGVPFATQPVVVLLDASNQVVSNATNPVTAAITSGTGTLIGTTTINASAGVAQFTDLGIAGGANTVITFTAGTLPIEPGSGGSSTPAISAVQVPRQLVVTTQPVGGLSGAPLGTQPVVAVRDAAGLPIAGNSSQITASIASGTGTLSGTVSVTAVNGVATFTNLVVNGGGPITLQFSSTTSTITPTASNPFAITVLAESALGIVTPPGAPTGVVSGVAFAGPTVEVLNSVGVRSLTATGTLTASLLSGPPGTTLDPGTTTATIVAGVATFSGLKISGPGPVTLQFASGALTPAQVTFPVTQTVAQLVITGAPVSISTGAAMVPPFKVEARDAAGVLVPGVTVTAALAAGYGSAGALANATAPAVAGTATFTGLTITGLGPVKFAFSVSGQPAAPVVSSEYAITQVGPPAAVQFVTLPSGGAGGIESGVPFSTQPSVRVVDASGTLVSSLNTGTVTVTLSGPAGTSVGGTLSAPIVGGVATFTDLRVNGPGPVTLTFGSGALAPAVSNPLAVVQTVRQLALIAGPSVSIISLTAMTPPFAVELRDAAGIKVATSTLPVTMTLSSGTGVLTGTATRAAVAGIATFPGMSTDAIGPVKFRFTLVNATAPPPLPTVETEVLASLYTSYGDGFYLKPIDNLPVINTIESGSKVAVKFTIGGNRGLGILAAGSPSSRPASCVNFAPTGAATPIEPKNSALSYNGNHYQITWETDKAWSGTCRILTVKLMDGSEHAAHFIIK